MAANQFDHRGYFFGVLGSGLLVILLLRYWPLPGGARLFYILLVQVLCGNITARYRPLPWRKQ